MWQTHDILQNNIDLSTVITIEDYQMNLKAKYRESPTAWHIPVTNRPLPYIPCVLNTWVMTGYFPRVR